MRTVAVEYPKLLVTDVFGSVLKFPLWWYGEGTVRVASWIMRTLTFRWRSYGFVIWIQNIFVPMYGQYDWAGRLVSFVMRIVVLVGRGIGYCVEALAYLFLFCLYLVAPVGAALLFLFNLAASL